MNESMPPPKLVQTPDAPVTNSIPGFNVDDLWRAEIVTDFVHGEIRVFTPVTVERVRDMARPMRFVGMIGVLFRGQQTNVEFEIPGETLAQALANFPDAARLCGEGTVKKLKLEEQASAARLLIPQGARVPLNS